jgi:hypothetical protein
VAVAVALGWAVAPAVAFFVATGLTLFVGADEVDDEADAEEPVPLVPIAVPLAMLIELVVDS